MNINFANKTSLTVDSSGRYIGKASIFKKKIVQVTRAEVSKDLLAKVRSNADPLLMRVDFDELDQNLLSSVQKAPFIVHHSDVDIFTTKNKKVGQVLGSPEFKGGSVIAEVMIDSVDGIQAINDGIVELSVGAKGEISVDNHQDFDLTYKFSNIDHIAIVRNGKMGQDAIFFSTTKEDVNMELSQALAKIAELEAKNSELTKKQDAEKLEFESKAKAEAEKAQLELSDKLKEAEAEKAELKERNEFFFAAQSKLTKEFKDYKDSAEMRLEVAKALGLPENASSDYIKGALMATAAKVNFSAEDRFKEMTGWRAK